MSDLILIFGSTLIISLIAFIGIITLAMKEKLLNKTLLILVSFSAGALMGGAFLHLLPEAIEKSMNIEIYLYLLFGFVIFFLIEKVLHWRHCHIPTSKKHPHTFAYMNLIGDTVHNFIDGLIIAVSFVTSIPLGIATTLAIAFHEIPQEIGDFGVLVYGGFNKYRALILNFLIALTVVFGGIVGYFVSTYIEQFTIFLLPLAAGGFIYIASSDLIPEIRKEADTKKSFITFIVFLFGILVMWVAKIAFV